jgi:hypothetical protein
MAGTLQHVAQSPLALHKPSFWARGLSNDSGRISLNFGHIEGQLAEGRGWESWWLVAK